MLALAADVTMERTQMMAAAAAITTSTTWNNGSTLDAVTITGGTEASPVVITVNGSVSVNNTITVESGYVKFTGGGNLNWKSAPSNAFVVEDGANVSFENVTLDGGGKTFLRASLLFCGTVTLKAGTTIQNFTSSGGSGSYTGK